MLPSDYRVYGEADFLFQQHLSPLHRAQTKDLMTMLLLCQLTHLT